MSKIHNKPSFKSNLELIQEALPVAMTYPQYRSIVSTLAIDKKTSGPLQTDALVNYTMLNDRRMKRWDKTFKITDEVKAKIKAYDQKMTWLVLTESWCGDASPALPVMQTISELNSNISLSIIFRDEHPELMNRFLTNGAMSIPKLIAIDEATNEVIATWGPRSINATKLVVAHKAEHGTILPEFKQELQGWYNKDKGQSILSDLLVLLSLK